MTAWKPGDRVSVRLPDRQTKRLLWFNGTVRELDTAPQPGVRVDLDVPVNGVTDCYATRRELRPASGENGRRQP